MGADGRCGRDRAARDARVQTLSLDHHLGTFEGEREVTGNDVVLWLEEAVVLHGLPAPASISVHSANPPAHEKMQKGIDAIMRRGGGGRL